MFDILAVNALCVFNFGAGVLSTILLYAWLEYKMLYHSNEGAADALFKTCKIGKKIWGKPDEVMADVKEEAK